MSVDRQDTRAAADTASLHRVGSLAQLRSSGALAVTVAGRPIAVFSVQGSVVATSGRCPHNRGPLHEGEIEGTTLTCPWHGYGFDVLTGACAEDPALVLERFQVEIQGDDILVRL
jgi:nitrite reductase (NADH) small subunit